MKPEAWERARNRWEAWKLGLRHGHADKSAGLPMNSTYHTLTHYWDGYQRGYNQTEVTA